jgi:serine/threonine protein kinase
MAVSDEHKHECCDIADNTKIEVKFDLTNKENKEWFEPEEEELINGQITIQGILNQS